MIEACPTCVPIQCCGGDNVFFYNISANSVFENQETGFLFDCPAGFNCQPGEFPKFVRVPKGSVTFYLPFNLNGPFPTGFPVSLPCIGGTITATIPAGATKAQIIAIANAMVAQCAKQQAAAAAKPQSPKKKQFYNGQQCLNVCEAPNELTGSVPGPYFLSGNNVCIKGGVIGSIVSQADADAKAGEQLFEDSDSAISEGTLICAPNGCFTDMSPLPAGAVGTGYSYQLTPIPTLDPGDVWAPTIVAGSLPPGLAIGVNAGLPSIDGTPTTPGVYCFTVRLAETPGGGGGGGS